MPAEELKAAGRPSNCERALIWSSPVTALSLRLHRGSQERPLAAGADSRRGAGDQEPRGEQTRADETAEGRGRIALTGTPVENRLGDLWSLFDFVNPGLLGASK